MGLDILEEDVDLSKIEIDQNFARRLEHNKKREALQRLKELQKQGRAGASDDSDDSSSDDDGEAAGGNLAGIGKKEVEFIRALNKIKKQDPILDQKDVNLFSDDDEEEEPDRKPGAARKEKPLYLKDVNALHLIEEGPEFDDEPRKHDSKIYSKEQADGLRDFLEEQKEAFTSVDDGDFMKLKEADGGDAEIDDSDAGEIQQGLDEYFGKDDNLNESEKFLKEYLLKQMWIDRDKDNKPSIKDIDVSEDEDELDRQDKYESEYNFRYEEAEQGDRILGHSRFTEGSVRKKTSSRKVQRKSKEERMAQVEFERKEELKQLKNLKKKEIQERLEKIRAVAGIGEGKACKLDEDDLEEDFDPEEYDRKMREIFDIDYYGAEDADPGFGSDADADMEKPDFDKEDELLGLPKGWDVSASKDSFMAARRRFLKQTEEEMEKQEDEEEMEKQEDKEQDMQKEGKRKRKRKISLKEKVELDKQLEEYYKLDYEDTIEDLKTRFKYKSVPANRYGLRAEEILIANDKDLNQYVPMKKLAPYRENEWKVTYHQKLKKSLILEGDTQKISKKQKLKGTQISIEAERKAELDESNSEANNLSRRSRRRHRQAELKLSQSRLMAYGKISSKPPKKH